MGLGSLEIIYFGAAKKYPNYSYNYKGFPIKKWICASTLCAGIGMHLSNKSGEIWDKFP